MALEVERTMRHVIIASHHRFAQGLADTLDFSVATFENYAHLSGSTRGDYPVLRETSSR